MLASTTKHKPSLTEENALTCAYIQMLTFHSYKYTRINYSSESDTHSLVHIHMLTSMYMATKSGLCLNTQTHTSALKYHDTNPLSHVQVCIFTLLYIPAHIYMHTHIHSHKFTHTSLLQMSIIIHPLTRQTHSEDFCTHTHANLNH